MKPGASRGKGGGRQPKESPQGRRHLLASILSPPRPETSLWGLGRDLVFPELLCLGPPKRRALGGYHPVAPVSPQAPPVCQPPVPLLQAWTPSNPPLGRRNSTHHHELENLPVLLTPKSSFIPKKATNLGPPHSLHKGLDHFPAGAKSLQSWVLRSETWERVCWEEFHKSPILL